MTSKQLKSEHKLRFIASSTDVVLTPLFKWTSVALKAVDDRCPEYWCELQKKAGVPPEDIVPIWMIRSADSLNKRIEDLNDAPMPYGDMVCHDVEQLYTNIEHADLKNTMHEFIDAIWKYMATVVGYQGRMNWENLVLVVRDPYSKEPPVWEHKATGTRNTEYRKVFSATDLKNWVDIAIENSYLKVGQAVLKQETGVPMGMNCSGWLAGDYMFWKEVQFMEQLIFESEAARKLFTRHFSTVARYADDRLDVDSRYIKLALYVNGFWGPQSDTVTTTPDALHPYRGIYPPCLKLKLEQSSADRVTHQDAAILRYIIDPDATDSDGITFKYRLQLYNKKTDKNYDKVRPHIVEYCDPTTMLSQTAIYGVVYSQTRRFAVRNSWEADFENCMMLMLSRMLELKYNYHKVMKQFEIFVWKHPSRFGPNSMWALNRRIRQQLTQLYPDQTN
jgi:hypothetical protein